jgi:hypothetical protein
VLHVGERAEAGWLTSAEVAGPKLGEALAIVGRQLDTDRPDIQGQRIVEVVSWWIALPAAHALLDGRLPDLAPGNTRVWVHDDPAPDGIGTLVLEDRAAEPSLAQLRAFVEAHLTDLVTAVCARTRRPAKALWRGVDDRVAAALIHVAQTRGEEPRGCALAREAYPGIDLRTLELPGYSLTVHVRSGCCLYYRIPKAKCWGCPLLTDDERRALTTSG